MRAFSDPLDEIHPHYSAMLLESDSFWQRYRAILDGFEYPAQKLKYLPAAAFETGGENATATNNAAFRRSITQFQGVSLDALDAIIGAVFAEDPVISSKSPELDAWIDDCFIGGLASFLEAKAFDVAGMGAGFVLVDAARDSSTSLSEADPGMNRPFLRFYKVEEVDDWDRADVPKWCKTRRVVSDKPSATEKTRYYIEREEITVESIKTWRKEITEGQITTALDPTQEVQGEYKQHGDEVRHGLGMLPMVDWPALPESRVVGGSFIDVSSRSDVDLLNHGSWQAMALYRHAHPVATLKAEKKPEQVQLGPNGMLWLQPNEEFAYASVPVDAFEARETVMSRIYAKGCRAAGMVEETSDAANTSGVAMRVRWSQRQAKSIKQFARSCERATVEILTRAAAYMSSDWERVMEETTVRFETDIDTGEDTQRLQNYGSFSLETRSPTFHVLAKKAIAPSITGKISDEDRDAMFAEFEAEGVVEPDSPPTLS